jgi:hypothetical protein
MPLAVCAGATSPADALRGCAARVDAVARARGARPAGLAAAAPASPAAVVPAGLLLSVPSATGGVLFSIYLSPVEGVVQLENASNTCST